MAGEPKKVGELDQASYKDALMIPVSDPTIPDGPSKETLRLNLGDIPGRAVLGDWDVTPTSSLDLQAVDTVNATFAGGVVSSDFDAVAPGGIAIGVVKTNVSIGVLANGEARRFGMEVTRIPGTGVIEMSIMGLAPAAMTAQDIADAIIALFSSDPITQPFVLAYTGAVGSGMNAGINFNCTNDLVTNELEGGQFSPAGFTTAAVGDKAFILLAREPGRIALGMGYHLVAGNGHNLFADVPGYTDNPVFPDDMTLFYAVVNQDSGGGYVALTTKPDLSSDMPSYDIVGTDFESGGSYVQNDWDTLFPSPFQPLTSYTQAVFPAGVTLNRIYRAVIDSGYSGPAATPYGITVSNGDYVIVENVDGGDETFSVLAKTDALAVLQSQFAAVNDAVNAAASASGTNVFFVNVDGADTSMTGPNVYTSFDEAFDAAVAVGGATPKYLVLSEDGHTINEPVAGRIYDFASNNIWVVGNRYWRMRGAVPVNESVNGNTVIWKARTTQFQGFGLQVEFQSNSFDTGYTVGGSTYIWVGDFTTVNVVQDGAHEPSSGVSIFAGNHFTLNYSAPTTPVGITVNAGKFASINIADHYDPGAVSYYLTLDRQYNALQYPRGTGVNPTSVTFTNENWLNDWAASLDTEKRSVYLTYVGHGNLPVPASATEYAFSNSSEMNVSMSSALAAVRSKLQTIGAPIYLILNGDSFTANDGNGFLAEWFGTWEDPETYYLIPVNGLVIRGQCNTAVAPKPTLKLRSTTASSQPATAGGIQDIAFENIILDAGTIVQTPLFAGNMNSAPVPTVRLKDVKIVATPNDAPQDSVFSAFERVYLDGLMEFAVTRNSSGVGTVFYNVDNVVDNSEWIVTYAGAEPAETGRVFHEPSSTGSQALTYYGSNDISQHTYFENANASVVYGGVSQRASSIVVKNASVNASYGENLQTFSEGLLDARVGFTLGDLDFSQSSWIYNDYGFAAASRTWHLAATTGQVVLPTVGGQTGLSLGSSGQKQYLGPINFIIKGGSTYTFEGDSSSIFLHTGNGSPITVVGPAIVRVQPQYDSGTGIITWRMLTSAEDAAWTALTLAGSWANIVSKEAEYTRNGNRVYVRGGITSGATSAISNLPAGFRPTKEVQKPVVVLDGGAPVPGVIIISTNGDVALITSATLPGTVAVHMDFDFAVN